MNFSDCKPLFIYLKLVTRDSFFFCVTKTIFSVTFTSFLDLKICKNSSLANAAREKFCFYFSYGVHCACYETLVPSSQTIFCQFSRDSKTRFLTSVFFSSIKPTWDPDLRVNIFLQSSVIMPRYEQIKCKKGTALGVKHRGVKKMLARKI
jgi:hypothetical protein